MRLACKFFTALTAIVIWHAALPPAHAADNQSAPPSPTNQLTIAVLSFENQTGAPSNSFWHFAMEGLLSGSLEEVKSLRLLAATDYALHQAKRKNGNPLTVAEAARAGEAIEARRIVWGAFNRKHDQWLLTVRLLNPATGDVATFDAASTNLFDVRDRLVEKILDRLSLRPSPPERKKIFFRATSSMTALEFLVRAKALHEEKAPIADVEAYARRAVAIDGGYAAAHMAIAAALFNQGKFDLAEQSISRALELRPDDAQAHMLRGVAFIFQKKIARAEAELLESVHLAPDDPEGWKRLGELRDEQDATAQAVECFGQALRLDPYSADIHARLGALYARQGRREQALAELKRAEQLAVVEDSGDEQGLAQSFDALHEIPSAVVHYEKLIALTMGQGANPESIARFQTRLKDLKLRLTPVYVSAAHPKDYTAAALSQILHQKLSSSELLLATNPLACTPEMDHWAHTIISGATNDTEKAQRLFATLSRHVDDGPRALRTAEQTFAVWNRPEISLYCYEYALLYTSLARAVGLDAFATYVEEECDGHHRPHACSAVFLDGKVLLVDPMYRWFGVPHKTFIVMDDLLNVAAFLANRQDLPSLTTASRLQPDSENVQFLVAGHLVDQERWDAARTFVAEHRLLDRTGWYWDLMRGALASHDGHDDKALDYYKKTLAQNSDSSEAYESIGLVYMHRQQWSEARANFRKALACGNDSQLANEIGVDLAHVNEIIGDAGPAAGPEPVTAQDFVNRGIARASDEELDKAVADFSSAIKLDPKSATAFLQRAHVYNNQGKHAQALADYNEALRLDPALPEGYEYRAGMYWLLNDHAAAIADLRQACELDPTNPETHNKLARLLIKRSDPSLGDAAAAIKSATKACELSDWKNGEFLCTLAFAYQTDKNNELALKYARLALSIPGWSGEDHKTLEQWIADYAAFEKSHPESGHPRTVDLADLKKSAESGDTKSQIQLAENLYEGKNGFTADRVAAYKWAALAAAFSKKSTPP